MIAEIRIDTRVHTLHKVSSVGRQLTIRSLNATPLTASSMMIGTLGWVTGDDVYSSKSSRAIINQRINFTDLLASADDIFHPFRVYRYAAAIRYRIVRYI